MTAARRALPVVLALVLAVSACGTGPESQTPVRSGEPAPVAGTIPAADPAHNAADVSFLQLMIDHNRQGLELTGLAADRTLSQEVELLAAAIDTTQRDEVTIMEAWLESWDEPATPSHDTAAHAPHADHGGSPATGPAEIEALRAATDEEFESMFLLLLTGHQNSAVELAEVAADGVNPQTQELAERIAQSRGDQVAQMLRLVGG